MKLEDVKTNIVDIVDEMFNEDKITVNNENDKLVFTIMYDLGILQPVLMVYLQHTYKELNVSDITLYNNFDKTYKMGFILTIEDKKHL